MPPLQSPIFINMRFMFQQADGYPDKLRRQRKPFI